MEAYGIIEFKRGEASVYLLAGEIVGIEPEALLAGVTVPHPMVDVRLRGGGVVRVSGEVEDVREQWVAALGRLVEAEGAMLG